MGAKRAVAGRSLPYDMLLAAYQKKNQAKQQSKIHRLIHICSSMDETNRIFFLQRLLWMRMRLLRTTKRPTTGQSILKRRRPQ
jgi:hypothetical protein